MFPSLTLILTLSAIQSLVSASDRTSLLPITSCKSIIPLVTCPMDASAIKIRKLCMNNFAGCPKDTYYLCGTTIRFIVESCQPDLTCNPGTSYGYVVNEYDPQERLECLPCKENRFETERTRSSLSSHAAGCTYQHRPPETFSSNLLPYEIGSASKAAKWICNYVDGFYEEHGNMYCDDVPTHPCRCVKKSCPMGYLLRPDGICVPCDTQLMPGSNFSCYDPLRHPDSTSGTNDTTGYEIKPRASSETGGNCVHCGTKPVSGSNYSCCDLARHLNSSGRTNKTTDYEVISKTSSKTVNEGTKFTTVIVICGSLLGIIGVTYLAVVIYRRNKTRAAVNAQSQNTCPLLERNTDEEESRDVPKVYYTNNENNFIKAEIAVIVLNGDGISPRKECSDSSSQEEPTDGLPTHLRMKPLQSLQAFKDVEETSRKTPMPV